MQITFAGLPIAMEGSQNGFDGVEDFLPTRGKQKIEWQQASRNEDDLAFPRGLRRPQVTFNVVLASEPDLDTAAVLRATFYQTLPDQGDLVVIIANKMITWAAALLEDCVPIVQRKGVTVGFKFTFVPTSLPVAAPLPFTDQAGDDFTDQAGDSFTPNS